MIKSLLYIAIFFVLTGTTAFAMESCGAKPCASCHNLTLKEANELLREVGEVKKVQLSPVNGLWLLELEREGRQGVVFMDFGKKNLIAGTVFPLQSKTAAGKPAAGEAQVAALNVAAIPLENSIIMGNPKGEKRLFVFTDPDCPFCARMHGELKKLAVMEPDLAIYVKLLPLKIHPQAYDRARVILGAKGKSPEMLDHAFSGAKLPAPRDGDDKMPVDDTIRFAESAGITVTPTLVLPDGRVMPGFREAAALKVLLAGGM